ncbi:bifunctional diguanylate cyclase/phosphodiesterase [Chitinimonas sp. BJB300]|uniref:bifunctional diguanylate cyclase/phosphodiesterase n=1 Tax=Chitinimonas sp. BJB300 TaxID=1559339 RepID=UPI000C11173A|nr:EAL domain-containing protein [Chitinimonas sp. BJB300]PHV11383.1 GGDEF domain-containing protein [Chitinimonas sp. BJB300]TSJ88898.1 EAL domain-containing protein [Chitinimonas sp. BJB300]
MSLLRQLWLVVAIATLMAFLGGFVVNLATARQYLEQQLLAQSNDTAASLALSMSQQSKDTATIELMVSALFDSGHFRLVRFENIKGQLIAERRSKEGVESVPAWFIHFVPLHVENGTGTVTEGWQQAGKVMVIAHDRFAYQSLWEGVQAFLAVMALIGLLSGFAIYTLMRWVRKPLDQLVAQATAIGEQHFITIQEPGIHELRVVVRSMNAMVARVKALFGEQAAHLDELRTQANRDALTGLANRDNFLGHLRQTLTDEAAVPQGALLLIRLHDLTGINRTLGRAGTDIYLHRISQALMAVAEAASDCLLARMNGADFAILASGIGQSEADTLAKQCLRALERLPMEGFIERSNIAHIGVGFYRRGSSESSLLSSADQALAKAENQSSNAVVLGHVGEDDSPGIIEWRTVLDNAITNQAFELATYPVLSRTGQLLHYETLLRLRKPDGGLQMAGQFIPFAARLGYLVRLDLIAVEQACQLLASHAADLAVHLSAAAVTDADFRSELQTLLARHGDAGKRFWFEVNEYALHGDYAQLDRLCQVLHRMGAKVGLEHFGRQFGHIPALHELQLDYVKIDGSFMRDIAQHPGNQQLVKAVISIAAGIGLQVIAEAVHEQAEWDVLRELGIDGMTGPFATELFRQQS